MYKIFLILVFISCVHGSFAQTDSAANGIAADTTKQGNVEKYGFQALFVNKEFNSSTSYDAQIHPQAWGFIQDYLDRYGKNLEKMKSWGKPYFDLYDNILTVYGLPREMKYLSVIESSLGANLVSWAGADLIGSAP